MSKRIKVNNIINRFKLQRLLDDTTTKNLLILHARTPNFFMQPKIHNEDNPGRPFISSINCHTPKIPQYVDHHLQLYVQQLGSYVNDSINFIKKVSTNDKVPQESFLVTVDACLLYNNIATNEGIKTIEKTIKRKILQSQSNHQFSEININIDQFYIQLQKLTNNKRCNGNKMYPNICKHLHGHI